MRFAVMLNRSLRLSYLFLAEISQAKMVGCIVEFREIIGDRLLKHIKSFENICGWMRLRSPLQS